MSNEFHPDFLETVNNLRYFEYGIKATKGVNDYLSQGHEETPELNWYTYTIFKGVVSGIYERLRNEGSQLIANHILLEEGVPQALSERQVKRLEYYDSF